MNPSISRSRALLLKLAFVFFGTLFMSTSAFACKWYDVPCKAKHEARKLAKKIKAAEDAAARLAQQAADIAAKAAADAAAAAAAVAKAEADAAFAALVQETSVSVSSLRNTYTQAATFSTAEYQRVQAAAYPFVSPFVALVNGCAAEMAAEPAGLLAQADAEVGLGWVNQDFQDVTEARAACAASIQAAGFELRRLGQKLAPDEIAFISNAVNAAGPCVANPERCAVQALEAFYDSVVQDLVRQGTQAAASAQSGVINNVTGLMNGAGGVTESIYRVIREIPTGKISEQGKNDLHDVIKFLGLQNSKGTAGIFFSPTAVGVATYLTVAFDLQSGSKTPQFIFGAAPTVGNSTTVKLGFFWSPYSGTDVANRSIGYPLPIPLPGVPPSVTGMFYPQWLMPSLSADMTQNLNNIKSSLSRSPTMMIGFMYNPTGSATTIPIGPLKTQIVNTN